MPRLTTALRALAFFWASAATIYLLVAAGYGRITTASALTGSEAVVGHIPVPLASTMGPWVVGLLVVITLVAGIPFGVALTYPEAHRALTWIVGLLLLGFSIVSGVGLGLMYLPGAVLLLASAVTDKHQLRTTELSTNSVP